MTLAAVEARVLCKLLERDAPDRERAQHRGLVALGGGHAVRRHVPRRGRMPRANVPAHDAGQRIDRAQIVPHRSLRSQPRIRPERRVPEGVVRPLRLQDADPGRLARIVAAAGRRGERRPTGNVLEDFEREHLGTSAKGPGERAQDWDTPPAKTRAGKERRLERNLSAISCYSGLESTRR